MKQQEFIGWIGNTVCDYFEWDGIFDLHCPAVWQRKEDIAPDEIPQKVRITVENL